MPAPPAVVLPVCVVAWETAGQSCLNLEVPFAFGSTDCSGVQAVRCLAYVDAGYGLAGGVAESQEATISDGNALRANLLP